MRIRGLPASYRQVSLSNNEGLLPEFLAGVEDGEQVKNWGGDMESKKNCLTCKFQPEWGKQVGKDYPRRAGKCRHPLADAKKIARQVPGVVVLSVNSPILFTDGSIDGVSFPCPTYEETKE